MFVYAFSFLFRLQNVGIPWEHKGTRRGTAVFSLDSTTGAVESTALGINNKGVLFFLN